MTTNSDKDYMLKAVELAKKGEGWVSTNPLVGAVIVKNNKIIGEGYHHKYADLHAERDALKNLTEPASGASMYVTLEPCCHYGKQPPCTQAIIDSGIQKVFIGSNDPNPKVSGKGISQLIGAGVEVHTEFLKDECDSLNPIFFHYVTKNSPYIALKYAMTADGKTATKTGDSKWISNEESRHYVHQLRHKYRGIMVGIGTVLCDNPMLNCRIDNGRNPVRIIVDSNIQIPCDSNIVKTANEIPTILAVSDEFRHLSETDSKYEKIKQLESHGIEIIYIPTADADYKNNTGKINTPDNNKSSACSIKETDSKQIDIKKLDIKKILEILAEQKIDSILVEGGASLQASFIENNLVNRIITFISPKICGGSQALSPVGGYGINNMKDAKNLKLVDVKRFGDDICIESDVYSAFNSL